MSEVTEYKYIRFEEVARKPKTVLWSCVNKAHGSVLGLVEWYGPWRQYCFRPAPETIWSRGCLIDVEHFLALMNEREK